MAREQARRLNARPCRKSSSGQMRCLSFTRCRHCCSPGSGNTSVESAASSPAADTGIRRLLQSSPPPAASQQSHSAQLSAPRMQQQAAPPARAQPA